MARESNARKLVTEADDWVLERSEFGDGPPPSSPQGQSPVLSNARLGVLVFLGAEVMFFAGLIGAFLVFRLGSSVWPPLSQPRLPLVVTGINTVILLMSGITVHWALRATRLGRPLELVRWLLWTAFLGVAFLAIQGYEWLRLIHFGLTLSSGVYGSTFYTLIGAHGLHVLGALVWLMAVLLKARQGGYSRENSTGVEICALYWTFVVALWPVLYGLVYLY